MATPRKPGKPRRRKSGDAACPDCGRVPSYPPKNEQQSACACRGERLSRAPEAPADETPASPLTLAARALADALEALGWDGAPDVLALWVRAASGFPLGHVDIKILPYAYIGDDQQVARVTAAAFLAGLRRNADPPPPVAPVPTPDPGTPPPVVTGEVLDGPGEQEPVSERDEIRRLYRRPWGEGVGGG